MGYIITTIPLLPNPNENDPLVKLGDVPGRFKELINRAGEKAAHTAGLRRTVGWYGKKPAAKMVVFYGKNFFWRLQPFFWGEERMLFFLFQGCFFENNW